MVTTRLNGLSGDLAIKTPVRVATTANITLSGLQSIDGITVVEGDRVLVKDQTDTTENGIYDASTGTWTRSKDFNGSNDAVKGTIITKIEGDSDVIFFQLISSNPISIGTSAITFTPIFIPSSGVYVSLNDTTSGVLKGKLLEGQGISFTENNDGADETLTILVGDTSITNSKLSDMETQTIKGRVSTGTGEPEDLTVAQITSMLNLANETIIINYLSGLILSNGTDTEHDINVSSGLAANSTNSSYLKLENQITKRIDATWVVGNNEGGLFSGAVATDTTYHVFLIKKDSDGTIDLGFDTSLTAANIPTGYTEYRRIGSIITDVSANIINFVQRGDDFIFKSPILDYNSNTTVAGSLVTLSVPLGINVKAYFNIRSNDNGQIVYLNSPDCDSIAPSASTSPLYTIGSGATGNSMQAEIWTNTSSQIRERGSVNTNNLKVVTLGWKDLRGV